MKVTFTVDTIFFLLRHWGKCKVSSVSNWLKMWCQKIIHLIKHRTHLDGCDCNVVKSKSSFTGLTQ